MCIVKVNLRYVLGFYHSDFIIGMRIVKVYFRFILGFYYFDFILGMIIVQIFLYTGYSTILIYLLFGIILLGIEKKDIACTESNEACCTKFKAQRKYLVGKF